MSKRKQERFHVSVTAATYARIRAASPRKGKRAQIRHVVEAALNADPAFAAYEVPRLRGRGLPEIARLESKP